MRTVLTILVCLLCFMTSSSAKPSNTDPVASFNALVDQSFDFYFSFHPTDGTASGFHQYDAKLEDYSAAAREEQIRGAKEFLGKFGAVDRSRLPPDSAADLDWIISSLHSELLELEDVQMWRKDPDSYTGGVTNSIFLIMKRDYASPEDRLHSAIERERQIPRALEAARQNLQSPPKIYTEIALEQLPDETDFFRKDVPEAFSAVKDPKLLAEFKTSNQAVIEAFESFQKYLKDSVLPNANGDFRIGAENYRKKLLYDEMVDIPLDCLLEIGYAVLR